MKLRPNFPHRFGSLEHGRSFCGDFFPWYNTEHHHVGLGLFTPHDVHYGLAAVKGKQRARVLAEAFAPHPEEFCLRFGGSPWKAQDALRFVEASGGRLTTIYPTSFAMSGASCWACLRMTSSGF